jgi:aspartate kinase
MKVFKFGGASINSVERIQNVGSILQSYKGEKILVIISAMGKTTNALEKVVDAFFEGRKDDALQLFNQVKDQHINMLKYLTTLHWQQAELHLKDFFTEIEWLLHDKPVREYDYYYDQIVCSGELLSTSMMSDYLGEIGVTNKWIDVRDIIRTDDNFRDATIDWAFTQQKVKDIIEPIFTGCDVIITQGFIGATDENESTTLGREGSDYSAAIFANLLNAESQTIWKDVEGVMNADPKQFADAKFLDALSYDEVIEMAYYGAQVIHPKTIKPLPVIVVKEKQVLMQFNSKDFSFVGEEYVGRLYELFTEIKIRPNLIQNGAISVLCCLDDKPDKIEKLALMASSIFDVQVQRDLTLLTIRHYTREKFDELTANKTILLTQRTTETIQALLR